MSQNFQANRGLYPYVQPYNGNFRPNQSQAQNKGNQSKCRKCCRDPICKGIFNIVFLILFLVFIVFTSLAYFLNTPKCNLTTNETDSSDLWREINDLKQKIQQLASNQPFNINTFCKDKIDGQYQHPTSQQLEVTCLDNSIYIGDIKTNNLVKGKAQQTMVKYHQFYIDQSCKNLIIRDLNSSTDYSTFNPLQWVWKGINQLSILLIMEKSNGIIQKWGFYNQYQQSLKVWKKDTSLDKILNLQKPVRYKFINPVTQCYIDDKIVPYCYKQLQINLSSSEAYKLRGLWDIESMNDYTIQDNEIYYSMQLYCKG